MVLLARDSGAGLCVQDCYFKGSRAVGAERNPFELWQKGRGASIRVKNEEYIACEARTRRWPTSWLTTVATSSPALHVSFEAVCVTLFCMATGGKTVIPSAVLSECARSADGRLKYDLPRGLLTASAAATTTWPRPAGYRLDCVDNARFNAGVTGSEAGRRCSHCDNTNAAR